MAAGANLNEFSAIAGLILHQLLEHHPIRVDVREDPVMTVMGVDDGTQKLESGRMFKEMFSATLMWLSEEGFAHSGGFSPRHGVRLTTKALAALNAMPPNLGGKSIGDSIAEAKGTDDARIATFFGDFIGSAAGSFTKSIGSGINRTRLHDTHAARSFHGLRKPQKPELP
jgi:hypothetical protein